MSATDLRQEDIGFQTNLYESKNPTRRWIHNVRRNWVFKAIEEVSPNQPHFLEIGIGCAIYTKHLALKGSVFAVDINVDFVKAANSIHNVEARIADITRDAFAPLHDVALCSEVLEHVPDSASALKNIFSSLRPGGHLVLTTPNSYSTVELTARLLSFGPIIKLARIVYGEAVDDLGHINRMTRHQLRQQIEAAGFEVVRQDNVAFYLPVIAEFMGMTGTKVCQWLACKLERTPLADLLWTQCWVLRRPLA